jgi:hypothetical protein
MPRRAKWVACDRAADHAFVPVCARPGLLFAAAIALLMLPQRRVDHGAARSERFRDLKIARPAGLAPAASPACAAACPGHGRSWLAGDMKDKQE